MFETYSKDCYDIIIKVFVERENISNSVTIGKWNFSDKSEKKSSSY